MKIELNKVYKARNGTEWKIVCIDGNLITTVNKYQNKSMHRYITGFVFDDLGYDYGLIELVGDDFTEDRPKLREFKFEGYLGEDEDETLDPASILESYLGHMACHMQRDKEDVNHLPKISKWEVTMKELPVEKKHNE